VIDVAVRRHVFDSQLPFQAVLGLLRQATGTT
jgi:hypothetical protein